ncbi:MAG TPA: YibE/F family protein, partial [Chromatiaceae bacterium]|nr:YibE/F family protein [Chromatiaceae bacterium]
LKILGGEEEGKIVTVKHGDIISLREDQRVKEGDNVVITKAESGDIEEYEIIDKYRLPGVALVALLFFITAIAFGRKQGLMSIIGLAITVIVLIWYIIPSIVNGGNPFVVSLIGAGVIAATSIYMSHGFKKRTTIAFLSTIITLVISAILSIIFVDLTRLSGAGTEESFFLQFGTLDFINLKGLLLGGIIIGALGVLDDITTAQSTAVEEIAKANPKLGIKELYKRGTSIGKEHIASLVNTLVLAYAGASFPLLILFSVEGIEPFWVTLNHEYMVEEIVRTLVGSTALIFAVPITTYLAARTFSKQRA